MDWRAGTISVFVVAVAAGGCAQDNPLFGLDGSGTPTTGPEETSIGGTRGSAGDNSAGSIDPTSENGDDVDPDGDDDDVDPDGDDDGDDDDGSGTGADCPTAAKCALDEDSCESDEKCTLYGSESLATGCTPLHRPPVGLGLACKIDDCGFDDCEAGLFCPRDSGVGCISLCSAAEPCQNGDSCIGVTGGGAAVGVCVPACDLVEQNCLDPESGCIAGSIVPNCQNESCCVEFCSMIGGETCPEGLSCQSAGIDGMPSVGCVPHD